MKLLSIIVPMNNMSKYLAFCLDSLVNQNIDKAEYEIILIDDGSTDNTLDIAKEYASKYDNIKVITKENGGVSSARNIELARIYQNDYNSRIVDDKEMLEYIKRSQHLATQGALTILPKSNLPYKQTMKMLRKEGFYPYPMQSQKLKTAKGIKQKLKYFIISLLKFRFFYGLYYFFTRRKK